MGYVDEFITLFLHIDKYLLNVFQAYGSWTYLILFLVIFCETGLVAMPFLPGDSLLMTVGALAALDTTGTLNLAVLYVLLVSAAIVGDTANYFIGRRFGQKLFAMRLPFLKPESLRVTHTFFEKYGGKTIIQARFVPIVRTFAPFVAGMSAMPFRVFIVYNIVGGVLWITLFLFAGYFVGALPALQENFAGVTALVVLISIAPIAIEWVRGSRTHATPKAPYGTGS